MRRPKAFVNHGERKVRGVVAPVQPFSAIASPRPATNRLRAELYAVSTPEDLVALFTAALAEEGVDGHVCVGVGKNAVVPLFGDRPNLLGGGAGAITLELDGARLILARPARALARADLVRIRGFGQLYAAQLMALRERADDVATECGLTLRERVILGRRLAGRAPLDIAAELGLGVSTVSASLDAAIAKLGGREAEAIALAARRGWLVVTAIQNGSSPIPNMGYSFAQNG